MSDNPYTRRSQKHTIGKAGRASEQRLTKALKGRSRPASGAMQGAKGDIDLGTFLMEAKSTEGESVGLKLDWLAKVSQEAVREGKKPALALSFVTSDGNPVRYGTWVCVRLVDFEHLFGQDAD